MAETQTPTLPSVAEYESVSTELNASVSREDITTALGRILDTDTRLVDPTFADIGALYAFTQAVSFDVEAMTERLVELRDHLREMDLTRLDAEIPARDAE
jgi:hypothetical protein